jgi:hypothetical protein
LIAASILSILIGDSKQFPKMEVASWPEERDAACHAQQIARELAKT